MKSRTMQQPIPKPDVVTLSPEAELRYLRERVRMLEREVIVLRQNIAMGR